MFLKLETPGDLTSVDGIEGRVREGVLITVAVLE